MAAQVFQVRHGRLDEHPERDALEADPEGTARFLIVLADGAKQIAADHTPHEIRDGIALLALGLPHSPVSRALQEAPLELASQVVDRTFFLYRDLLTRHPAIDVDEWLNALDHGVFEMPEGPVERIDGSLRRSVMASALVRLLERMLLEGDPRLQSSAWWGASNVMRRALRAVSLPAPGAAPWSDRLVNLKREWLQQDPPPSRELVRYAAKAMRGDAPWPCNTGAASGYEGWTASHIDRTFDQRGAASRKRPSAL